MAGGAIASGPVDSFIIYNDHAVRFESKVQRGTTDEACDTWVGRLDYKGYGVFWDGSHEGKAHVWAWEQEHGPVPSGLELDHLCRDRSCVKTLHLESVSHAENMRRSSPATKTHCKRAHPYAVYGYVNKQGRRCCGICDQIRYRQSSRGQAVKNPRNVDIFKPKW